MSHHRWKAEVQTRLLDAVMNAQFPEILLLRESSDKALIDCPSALQFCATSRKVNELCEDSDYILHCKLKSFMIRRNAEVSICITTEKDPKEPPMTLKVEFPECTTDEMQMFIHIFFLLVVYHIHSRANIRVIIIEACDLFFIIEACDSTGWNWNVKRNILAHVRCLAKHLQKIK